MQISKCYSQRDPRWAGIALGTTGRTIGSHGCLVTAICDGLANFSKDITPDKLVQELNKLKGLAPSGDLDWKKLEKIFPTTFFVDRIDTSINVAPNFSMQSIDVAIKRCQKIVRQGMMVLLNVDGNPYDGWQGGDHWVRLLDTDFNIMDPWYGHIDNLNVHYGEPRKAIFGYGTMYGMPISFAEPELSGEGNALAKLKLYQKDPKAYSIYLKEAIDHLTSI
jgi:hypothetical protein